MVEFGHVHSEPHANIVAARVLIMLTWSNTLICSSLLPWMKHEILVFRLDWDKVRLFPIVVNFQSACPAHFLRRAFCCLRLCCRKTITFTMPTRIETCGHCGGIGHRKGPNCPKFADECMRGSAARDRERTGDPAGVKYSKERQLANRIVHRDYDCETWTNASTCSSDDVSSDAASSSSSDDE